MISLVNVSKKFKDEYVLNNISLELESGKIYGITGRNGSGKSILFKTLCGFLRPDSGEVIVNNINLYKSKSFPESTSALIEKPKFLDNVSGLDNLLLLAKIKGNVQKNQIIELLNRVGIDEKNQIKEFKKYSVGTKQKLGIAQVLMEDDTILIFDEPFSGLDDQTVQNVRNILLEERKKGKLILVSSHIKEDIDVLCDIVYRIDMGKIEIIKNKVMENRDEI